MRYNPLLSDLTVTLSVSWGAVKATRYHLTALGCSLADACGLKLAAEAYLRLELGGSVGRWGWSGYRLRKAVRDELD